jgi:hypothetical protein
MSVMVSGYAILFSFVMVLLFSNAPFFPGGFSFFYFSNKGFALEPNVFLHFDIQHKRRQLEKCGGEQGRIIWVQIPAITCFYSMSFFLVFCYLLFFPYKTSH